MENKIEIRIECEECGSGDVYTTQDGTRVCRRCGHRDNQKKKGGKIK
jgi:hypothetical protein